MNYLGAAKMRLSKAEVNELLELGRVILTFGCGGKDRHPELLLKLNPRSLKWDSV